MKKLILALLMTIGLHAKKTDIYFGNGILTIEIDAKQNTKLLKLNILKRLYGSDENLMMQDIGKIDYAYNQTKGMVWDLLESSRQQDILTVESHFKELKAKIAGQTYTDLQKDMKDQYAKYNQSLDSGNRVIVVAHSQGNLFAGIMQKLIQADIDTFHIIHVASPDRRFFSNDIVAWDNDMVVNLGLYSQGIIDCDIRKVTWEDINQMHYQPKPKSNYAHRDNIDENTLYLGKWKVQERTLLLKLNSLVHAFTFYMGEPLKQDIPNPTAGLPLSMQTTTQFNNIPDAIDGSNLVDTRARDRIIGYIQSQLEINSMSSGTGGGETGGSTGGNTGGTDTGGSTGGTTNPSSFDFKTVCSGTDFPDPVPDELKTTIDGILNANASNLVSDIVCPLIDGAVTAYNLANGGGVPGGM